jgi:hypothetical protein
MLFNAWSVTAFRSRLPFRLRPYPGAKRQGRALGRQSVEHPLNHGLAQFVRLFAWPNEPVSDQLRESVHERPARQNSASDLAFVTRRIWDRLAQSSVTDKARQQGLGRLRCGSFDRGAALIRAAQVAAEHQSVERWILDAVANVGAQDREELCAGMTYFRGLDAHALRQRLEPDSRNPRQQLAFVGEVLVRGVVTDAGTPRELAQRKLVALRFAQDLKRGCDDGAAQVAMVIRTVGKI